MLTINNNVSISGKYKLLWWEQEDSYCNYAKVLSKVGFDNDLMHWNQSLINLEVEDSLSDSVLLTFGPDWDRMDHKEVINPGQIVEEEICSFSGKSCSKGMLVSNLLNIIHDNALQ